MVQSLQNSEEFAKLCKKIDLSSFKKTNHSLLQPKLAAKPSQLEKWLVRPSDSKMFNDLIVDFISP